MGRVIHFEFGADQPERAVAFYQKVFGWKIEKWAGPIDYWLITTGSESENGIDGAIMARAGGMTTVNTVAVDSLDDALARVAEAGGKVISEKQVVPGVGYHAYCVDSEGNMFGLMQGDASLK